MLEVPDLTIDKDDPLYRSIVREMRCAVLNGECYGDIVPHHATGSGWALKWHDFLTMPLCHVHHNGARKFGHCVHNGTQTFEEKYRTQANMIKETQRKAYAIYIQRGLPWKYVIPK